MTTVQERFWAKVTKHPDGCACCPLETGCWLWTAALFESGYGHFYADGRYLSAHRYAFEMETGAVPRRYVLHRCDVRACVRPLHLFEGTQKENIADAMAKGRLVAPPVQRGEANNKAKINLAIADEIRSLCSAGMRQADAGARFGISQGVVSKIVRKALWATRA